MVGRFLSGVVLTGSLLMSGCGASSDAAPAKARDTATLTVTSVTVDRRTWRQQVRAQGLIAPWQDAEISARLAGQPIVEIQADIGDAVRVGQPLLRFDDAIVRNEVAQAEAAVAEARAALDEADAHYRRTEALLAEKLISEQDALTSQTRQASAAARLQSAEAALAHQRLRLDYTVVRAPDDGTISAKHAALGQVPQPGQALFTLIRQNRLEWRAEVLPEQVGRLSTGTPATVSLEDGSRVSGAVTRISPALRADTRLVLVHTELEPGSSARAGMFVSGDIHLDAYQALAVPEASLVLRDGRSYVYGIGSDTVCTAHRVEIGQRQDGWVEIVDGLEAGMNVAVDGAGFLSDGQRVSVNNEPLQGASP